MKAGLKFGIREDRPHFWKKGRAWLLCLRNPRMNILLCKTGRSLRVRVLFAHEIKGYDKWKLITDAGQQKDVLSLLSEFAQLDPSCLLSSWSKWTFSTYLQPSESPDNFQIIAGEPSVPSFALSFPRPH